MEDYCEADISTCLRQLLNCVPESVVTGIQSVAHVSFRFGCFQINSEVVRNASLCMHRVQL